MKTCFSLLLCLASLYAGAQTAYIDDPCASGEPLLTVNLDPEPVSRYLEVPEATVAHAGIAIYGPAGSEVTSFLRITTADTGRPAYDLQLLPPGVYYLESATGVRTLIKE